MPGVASDIDGNGAVVPFSGEAIDSVAVYPLRHGLARPISGVAISWARGNALHVSLFAEPSDADAGGKVLEAKLTGGDPEIADAHWRRIAYGSVAPFAMLQSRRSSLSTPSKAPPVTASPYYLDW